MKNSGNHSKKAGRVQRAKERKEAFEKLSTAEQEAQKLANKREYDASHKN